MAQYNEQTCKFLTNLFIDQTPRSYDHKSCMHSIYNSENNIFGTIYLLNHYTKSDLSGYHLN